MFWFAAINVSYVGALIFIQFVWCKAGLMNRLYNHAERRRDARTRVFKAAQLFAEARIGCCVVRNISILGAGLTMESAVRVPDLFDLSFDGGRTLRPCRVLWRTATEIGLEFQGKSYPNRIK